MNERQAENRQNRRNFLRTSAALAGSAFAGGAAAQAAADNAPPNVPAWMKKEGRALSDGKYGLPSAFEKEVVRRGRGDQVMPGSGSAMTPLHRLHGMITPNGLVFERSHAGIPEIDPAQHRLMVHGMVKQPLILTMDDLMRFPSVSRIHFLECSGNTSREWRSPFAKSVQVSHGLLSCCEWTGVALSTILDEVGVQPGAQWVLAEGADAAAMTRLASALDSLEAIEVPREHRIVSGGVIAMIELMRFAVSPVRVERGGLGRTVEDKHFHAVAIELFGEDWNAAERAQDTSRSATTGK